VQGDKTDVVAGASILATSAVNWLVEKLEKTTHPTLLLATGRTPLDTYAALVSRVAEAPDLVAGAKLFALDEYCGLEGDDLRSFRNVLWQHVAEPLGIPQDRLITPNGAAADPAAEAVDYENRLAAKGYADIAILGVGTNGHVAFNEPGVSFDQPSHVVTLTEETRIANAANFGADPEQVPRQAITVGVSTILKSRHILLLAHGAAKRQAIGELLSGKVSPQWPVTALHTHPSVHLIVDQEAWPGS
jgi:glucosamine-6-phosphate deaminase